MRHFWILFLTPSFFFAQETTPFMVFDASLAEEYQMKRKEIQREKDTLQRINKLIFLASSYKNQEDLILALKKKIDWQGETAKLRYLLGGANGIKALQTRKIFSIPYVKKMLNNFSRAVELDPSYSPAVEAYAEALCMVPSLLGGNVEKAEQLAKGLLGTNEVGGNFLLAQVAEKRKNIPQAKAYCTKAFQALINMGFCEDTVAFFDDTSMNFPYKIAEKSVQYALFPQIGLCAVDYFISQNTPRHNLPLEWAFLRKAQLHLLLGDKTATALAIEEALRINPNFDKAKALKKRELL